MKPLGLGTVFPAGWYGTLASSFLIHVRYKKIRSFDIDELVGK